MATPLTFEASQPSNTPGGASVLPGGETLPYTLPATTTVALADLGVYLTSGPPNRVDLVANVGIDPGDISTPSLVTFTLTRDGSTIYTTEQEVRPVNGVGNLTVQGVDFDVPAGFHTYDFNVSSTVAGVIVDGPISFTATAWSMP